MSHVHFICVGLNCQRRTERIPGGIYRLDSTVIEEMRPMSCRPVGSVRAAGGVLRLAGSHLLTTQKDNTRANDLPAAIAISPC